MNGIPLRGSPGERGRQMNRMKAQGLVVGASDLKLCLPRRGYHGLCLEVKTEKGKPTKEQKAYLEDYLSYGWKAVVGRGFEECWEIIEDYMRDA